jgi:hypothetical protein
MRNVAVILATPVLEAALSEFAVADPFKQTALDSAHWLQSTAMKITVGHWTNNPLRQIVPSIILG